MFEKVNPAHPDKIADRIAGAIVDLAYAISKEPKVSVEVLLGHGRCMIIIESSVGIPKKDICSITRRLAGIDRPAIVQTPQDPMLAANQKDTIRCGDNGIFRGVPLTDEQRRLSAIARDIYLKYPSDGKYILDGSRLVICQSLADRPSLAKIYPKAKINPLGYWYGGPGVDAGATNRKLGSDMADSITGGGLHGKDLSKADVSVNIYAFLKAQKTGEPVELSCAIGDETVDGKPYSEIVEIARNYIRSVGGFENFAMWGLV